MLIDPKMPTKLFCLFYATVERNRACAFMKKFKLTYPLKISELDALKYFTFSTVCVESPFCFKINSCELSFKTLSLQRNNLLLLL